MEERFDSKFSGFSSKSFIIFTRNTTSYTGPLVTHHEPFLSLSRPLLTHSATGLPDSSCGSACFNCRHAAALPSLAARHGALGVAYLLASHRRRVLGAAQGVHEHIRELGLTVEDA
jgi:hypothetical protein